MFDDDNIALYYDKDKITASVNNGVLAVVLPKVSQEDMKKESKVIDIK